MRVRRSGVASVSVLVDAARSHAHYGGLQTCASVWACPLCAARISERRRLEVLQAIAAHTGAGGGVNLLTLTHSHGASEVLAGLLARQTKALTSFYRDRAGVELFSSLGRVGHIRAWEVTHGGEGGNGWHPHFHILLFLASPLAPGALSGWEGRIYDHWRRVALRAGLGAPSRAHGVRLEDGGRAARYAAKWGLDYELTKGHTKKARSGETPWDFLRVMLRGEGDRGELWREYATAFHGRRQLVWSRGLRERFGLDSVSDEDLAVDQEESAEVLGLLNPEQWAAVLRLDLRGEVLELARHGWAAVSGLLDGLQGVGVVG